MPCPSSRRRPLGRLHPLKGARGARPTGERTAARTTSTSKAAIRPSNESTRKPRWRTSRAHTRARRAKRSSDPSSWSSRPRRSSPACSPSARTCSEQPAPVLLDDVAVAQELPAWTQVLDHVPMDDAFVLAAERGEARADRQVDGPVDLLIEERVLDVPLDAGVATDSELA